MLTVFQQLSDSVTVKVRIRDETRASELPRSLNKTFRGFSSDALTMYNS